MSLLKTGVPSPQSEKSQPRSLPHTTGEKNYQKGDGKKESTKKTPQKPNPHAVCHPSYYYVYNQPGAAYRENRTGFRIGPWGTPCSDVSHYFVHGNIKLPIRQTAWNQFDAVSDMPIQHRSLLNRSPRSAV